MGAVGDLTLARLRHHPGRWALVATGVALALALPVVSAATARVVAARALSTAVEALPPGERTVIAAYGGSRDPAQERSVDTLVRAGLGRLTASPAVRQMIFGEIADSTGATYRLAASDGLASQVRVTSGRLPASCTPARCEVLLTGPGPAPRLSDSLGLVVVGTGVRTDALLLPGTFDPGPAAVLLLGSDAATMQQLQGLAQFPRGVGWVAPLDPARVASLGVPAYADLSRQVDDDLSLHVRALRLAVPDDALVREDARASASRGRFALLGGTSAVLALGFVLVAAVGLRREHLEVAGLLRRRGASTAAVTRFALLVASAAVLAGAVFGAVAGWAVAWATASATPLAPPALALAASSVLDALPWLILLVVLAVALTTSALRWPRAREATAWHVVELGAVACAGAALLVAARGAVGISTVGGDPLSVALPVLVLAAGALVAARVWVPIARAASRHLPSGAVALRLAAASGVRRPLRTVVTVGFVTAAVGSVVFAGAYRATLQAGSADTAAFQVPTAARLTVGPQGSDPVTLSAATALPATTYDVVRGVAGVRTSATSGDAVALLGVDGAALTAVSRWDRSVGGSSAAAVSSSLGTAPPVGGIPVEPGALRIPVRSWAPDHSGNVEVVAWVSTADGRERGVALTAHGGELEGTVPDVGAPVRLTALTMRENTMSLTRRLHRSGEGGTAAAALAGRVVLGAPTGASGWAGWSSTTADITVAGPSLTLDYALTGPLVVVRPGLAERSPVRVITDETTASRGTTLRLDLGGGDSVAAVVVGSLPRFPTLGQRFVLAERSSLAATLDDHEPGSGAPHEIWAATDDSASMTPALGSALATAPYDQVVVRTQADARAALESDAVAQGAAALLLTAALVSLVVALLSLVLLVLGERRDDAGQLFAQEADGVATSTLRRSLWWRATAAAVPALVLGTAAGLLLARSVSTLVALSASGTAPVPPLLPAVGTAWTTAVLAAGTVVALAVCALVAARTLRAAWPERPEQDLR